MNSSPTIFKPRQKVYFDSKLYGNRIEVVYLFSYNCKNRLTILNFIWFFCFLKHSISHVTVQSIFTFKTKFFNNINWISENSIKNVFKQKQTYRPYFRLGIVVVADDRHSLFIFSTCDKIHHLTMTERHRFLNDAFISHSKTQTEVYLR